MATDLAEQIAAKNDAELRDMLCLGCYRLEWFSHVESRLEEE